MALMVALITAAAEVGSSGLRWEGEYEMNI